MSAVGPTFETEASGATTVLATVTVGLASFIAAQGGDPDGVFGRAGFPIDLDRQPNSPISLAGYCRVLDEAAQRTQNENFGLWFGRQFPPEALGLLGYLAVSSPTLGQALENMVAHFPSHQGNSLFRLACGPRVSRLEYRVHDGAILDRRQDAELSLGMFCNVFRRALGTAWAPLKVEFEHPRPGAWRDHGTAFQAEVAFEQAGNALVFRSDALMRPMPDADARLLAIVRQSMELLQRERRGALRLADRVKAEILALLPQGEPRLEQVSERVHLPAWTLQRRLSEEGATFKTLLEEVRRTLARALLEEGRLSISELAFRLGYTEVSTFSRAFVRWYGVPPRVWRQRSRRA